MTIDFELIATGIALATMAIALAVLGQADRIWRKRNRRTTLEDKIETLNIITRDAGAILDQVEGEIVARAARVEAMKAEAEKAELLPSLNKKQSLAVAQAVRGEIKAAGRWADLKQILINLVFFALGVLATVLIGG